MINCEQAPTFRVGRTRLIILTIWLALMLLSTAWTVLNRSSYLTHHSSPPISWQRLSPPTSEGLVRHVVVIDRRWDRVYVLGGKTVVGDVTSDKVYYASLLVHGISRWDSSNMPALLYSTAGVASQGRIYLAGGYDDTNKVYTTTVYSAQPDQYTGKIARWDLESSLPVSVANHSLVAYGGYLYLVGGQTRVGDATPTLSHVYCAKIDSINGGIANWISTTPLLTSTAGHATVVHNGNLYVLGGFTKSGPSKVGLTTVVYGEIDSMNGSIRRWASTKPLPVPLYHHAAIVSGNYIYVIGGYDDSSKQPSSAVYRAQMDTAGALEDWEEVSQTDITLPPLQRHGADTSNDGSMYIVGGATDSGYSDKAYYVPTIAFSKLADPGGMVYVGDRITYTILFNSTGIRAFKDMLITDSIPSSTRLVTTSISATVTSGSYVITPSWDLHMITFTIPHLSESATGVASFQVDVVDPSAVGVLMPTQEITPTTWLSTPALISTANVLRTTWADTYTSPHLEMPEQGCISGNLIPSCADLSLEKSSDQASVVAGQALTYTLLVYNDGPVTAEDVVVTDDLPGGVTLTLATPPPSSTSPLTWYLGSILSETSKVITLMVQVDPRTSGTLTNVASVDSSTPDPNADNNKDEEQTDVVTGQADLRIEKSDSLSEVVPGETLVYSLRVNNDGPSDARNVVVSDTLPAGVSFRSSAPPLMGGLDPLTWYTDVLSAGEVWTIEVTVAVNSNAVGILTNTVCVGSSDSDPDHSDNCDENQIRAPIPVVNRAYICEDGLWCKEAIVINPPFSVYLPIILKTSS